MRLSGWSFTVGLAVLAPGVSRAATYHVDPNGSDENSCEQAEDPATPRQTVYEGMRCLYAGDTLLIQPGTYHPQAPNGGGSDNISDHFYGTDEENRITIMAAVPGAVVFAPAESTVMAHAFDYYDPEPGEVGIGSYVTYDGFVFDMFTGDRDADCPGPAGGGVLTCTHAYASAFRFEANTGAYSIIRNCEIRNFVGTAFMNIGDHSQFLGNHVHDNVPYTVQNQETCIETMGLECWNAGGYDYSSYSTYRGNTFANLGLVAFQYWDDSRGAVQGKVFDQNVWIGNGYQYDTDGSLRPGAALVNGTNGGGESPIVVTNNLFVSNYSVMAYPSQNTIFANNTIVNNEIGIDSNSIGPQGVILNNVFSGNGSDVDGTVEVAAFASNVCGAGACPEGNLNGVDPLFVDAEAGDFHLMEGSPAIDTGTAVPEVTEDLDGILRPQGAAYDMGAFENCPGGCGPADGGVGELDASTSGDASLPDASGGDGSAPEPPDGGPAGGGPTGGDPDCDGGCADGSAAPPEAAAPGPEGCDCRVASPSDAPYEGALLLAALVVASARRRRRAP